MTVNNAIAKCASALLQEKEMSRYHLEQEYGIQTVTLSTVILLARGFGMTLHDFLNDSLFASESLDPEK